MDAKNDKRKAKRTPVPIKKSLSKNVDNIDNNNRKKLSIYAGSEEKMLNLVVEIVVKIILKEIL